MRGTSGVLLKRGKNGILGNKLHVSYQSGGGGGHCFLGVVSRGGGKMGSSWGEHQYVV